MKPLIVLVSALFLAQAQVFSLNAAELSPADWRDCGKPSDLFTLQSLAIEPEQPRKGESLKIRVQGHLKEEISGGVVDVIVKLGILVVVRERRDLCEAMREIGGGECPVPSGELVIEKEEMLPKSVPKGRYTVQLSAKDAHGKGIFCVSGQFIIKD